jgi:phage tail-like protein
MAVTSVFVVLELDGGGRAVFSNVTISSHVEPVEAQRGDAEPTLPQARRILPTVTLQRRHDDDLQLFAWHQSIVDGPIASARKSCLLTVFDASGLPLGRYHLEMAWPIRVQIGPLQAGAEEILPEVVTLICENIRRLAL